MNLDIIRAILDGDKMPDQRYQDPAVEKRTDVKRPYYQIRPYVPIVTDSGKIERKQKPIRLGFVDETSVREAKARKQEAMVTINNGKFLVQSQIPFKAVLDRYVEVRLPQIPACVSYGNIIKNHIRPAFSGLRMCDIDKPAVEAWLNAKTGEGYSHNTLLDLRKVLSVIFSQAEEWKLWQGDNPCWGLKNKIAGVAEVYSKKLPTQEGLARFLGALEDTCIVPADGARLIVLASLAIGTRVCEVLGLQRGDIDVVAETVTIQRDWTRGRLGATKTPESKRTRQAPGVALDLARYAAGKRDDEFIFARADQGGIPPDDRDLQNHVFRPALEKAGIYVPGFGLRRFRHLNVSWRQEAGAHPIEAMKAAGHTKLSTTWVYTQTDTDRERAHVNTILWRVQGDATGPVN